MFEAVHGTLENQFQVGNLFICFYLVMAPIGGGASD